MEFSIQEIFKKNNIVCSNSGFLYKISCDVIRNYILSEEISKNKENSYEIVFDLYNIYEIPAEFLWKYLIEPEEKLNIRKKLLELPLKELDRSILPGISLFLFDCTVSPSHDVEGYSSVINPYCPRNNSYPELLSSNFREGACQSSKINEINLAGTNRLSLSNLTDRLDSAIFSDDSGMCTGNNRFCDNITLGDLTSLYDMAGLTRTEGNFSREDIAVSNKDVQKDIKELKWDKYGKDFNKALKLIAQKNPEIYKNIVEDSRNNKININGVDDPVITSDNSVSVGYTTMPDKAGDTVDVDIQKKGRANYKIAGTVIHEYTHTKMINDLKVSEKDMSDPKIKEVYTHITELLAHRKEVAFMKDSGYKVDEEDDKKIRYYVLYFKVLEKLLKGEKVSEEELKAYNKEFGKPEPTSERPRPGFLSLLNTVEELNKDDNKKKRVMEFINYYHRQF
ncbi:MAG: hypothetical protein ABRQ37_25330 [Candidatus Eremiobacterota bacterium]